eukprot:g15474.t1
MPIIIQNKLALVVLLKRRALAVPLQLLLPVGQLETENARNCLQRDSKRNEVSHLVTSPAFVKEFHMFNQAPHFVFTGLGGCGTGVAHSLRNIVEHGSQA